MPIEVPEFQSESMFGPFLPIKMGFGSTLCLQIPLNPLFLPMKIKTVPLKINKIARK